VRKLSVQILERFYFLLLLVKFLLFVEIFVFDELGLFKFLFLINGFIQNLIF